MEKNIWKNSFENQLNDYGIHGVWSFYVEDNLQPQPHYLQYPQRTFARFQCSRCSRFWHSAQVHILVLINWDRIYRRGTVKMRILRQRCRRCYGSILETPEISEENIRRVISNVTSKIQSMVNGYTTRLRPLEPEVYSDDVDGPHEKKYCEACEMKMCPLNDDFREQAKETWPTTTSSHYRPTTATWPTTTSTHYRPTTAAWETTTSAHYRPTAVYQEENNKVYIALFLLFIFIVLFLNSLKQ